MSVVLITGASSGIGFSLSIEFAQKGYKVYAGARNVKRMAPLKSHGIIPVELDITSKESIQKVHDLIIDENKGKIDIIYNNAGIAEAGSLFDSSDELIISTFQTNVIGTIHLLQIFQKDIIKNKSVVAFTGSIATYIPIPYHGVYAASKSSLELIAKTLAMETGSFGVKVLYVATGTVETPMITSKDPYTPPKGSIYYLEPDKKEESVTQKLKQDALPSDVYARQVVKDVGNVARGKKVFTQVYRGQSTTLARIILTFLSFNSIIPFVLNALGFKKSFEKIKQKLDENSSNLE